MSRFKLFYFVIFIINFHRINAQISDKRLCVDEECKVPISHAKTLLRYSSPDSRILSFAPNVDVTIYSKSAGSREDLWGGEINGKRGYVPKHMVRETKILKKPTLLVDTEFSNDTEVPSVEPDGVQKPYEVVDGTTIYLTPQDDISPTSTESTVQSTALPGETNGETPPVDNQIVQSQEEEDEDEDDDDDDEGDEDVEIDIEGNDSDEGVTEASNLQPEVTETETQENPQNEATIPEPKVAEAQQILPEENASIFSEPKVAENETPLNEAKLEEQPVIQEETATLNEGVLSETLHEGVVSEPNLVDPTSSSSQDSTPEPPILEPADSSLEANASESELPNPSPDASDLKVEEIPKEDPKFEANNQVEDPKFEALNQVEDPKFEAPNQVEDPKFEAPNHVEETTVAPSIDVTTFTPELEVPQPFEDGYMEVTQDPQEAPPLSTEAPTLLPPLGLFGGATFGSVAQNEEKPSSEETVESATIAESQSLGTEGAVGSEEIEGVVASEEIKGVVANEEIIDDLKKGNEVEEAVVDQKVEEIEPGLDQGVEETKNESVLQDEVEEKKSSEEQIQDYLSQMNEQENEVEDSDGPGFFAGLLSFFTGSEDQQEEEDVSATYIPEEAHSVGDELLSQKQSDASCESNPMDFFSFNSDVFLYLVTTAISVIIFLFGYIALDKSKREGPLIAKINKLEKELLVILKENQILQEKSGGCFQEDGVSSEVLENLKLELLETRAAKAALEDQVQSLEKELENSTEVGMELNRMLSEILSSEGGSEVLKANVEHFQRQLVEQQSTINSVNETLAVTNTENHELRLEVEINNKKIQDLQSELDKLLLNILKIEEEKDNQQLALEAEIATTRQKLQDMTNKLKLKEDDFNGELKQLQSRLTQTERKLALKAKEYEVLTETLKQLKTVKNKDETLKSLLEVGGVKAELQQLTSENLRFADRLQQEEELRAGSEKRALLAVEELRELKQRYDEVDKLRVESQTKLEVLSNYFKDREAQLQKEISKHEALWAEKEGEATSTTERIRFMQEQLQNYKIQTESLKQEIMSQEIELKSQISVLEKKAHENWVSARQAERKAEDAKQEAAQLRHRLTIRERAFQEDKNQHRLLEQNGDLPESPASPPLLYSTRDHITKSPPLPGLPPFLPPPPGVPFMPPPIHGVPPFIPPPPPNMFPGDHRPPPLGRMSSPPLNSRYSPNYSSSPSDSEYGTSPPHRRGYSPFNNRGEERRDYKRPPPGRSNGRSLIKGGSSGSGHSNESLEKISRQQSKV